MNGLAELLKASFGGDRSAAGRYAAEQRWKGHVKEGKRFRSRGENRWGADRLRPRFAGQRVFIERKWEIDKMPALREIPTDVLYKLATNFDDLETSIVIGAGYPVSVDSLEEADRKGSTNELETRLPPKDDRTEIVHSIVAAIFSTWEHNTNHRPALQAKRAARDEFGLKDSKEIRSDTVKDLPPEEYRALKAVLRAVHQRTQMHLSDTGVKDDATVTLFRATQAISGEPAGTTVDYQSEPLTSFTRDREVAAKWGGPKMLTAKVPRTQVFFINNVFLQGGWYGEEGEVVLLGGKIEGEVSRQKPRDAFA